MAMYSCSSLCTCGLQLVLCEADVVVRIRTKHRKLYGLPYPGDQWVARCRRCGRHYLISGHESPAGETAVLYPHFLYHTVVSWNQLRRRQQGLAPVSLEEMRVYWRERVPELSWEAAIVNAFETDQEERNSPKKAKKSYVYGQKHCDLEEGASFRRENDLAFPIPYMGKSRDR